MIKNPGPYPSTPLWKTLPGRAYNPGDIGSQMGAMVPTVEPDPQYPSSWGALWPDPQAPAVQVPPPPGPDGSVLVLAAIGVVILGYLATR